MKDSFYKLHPLTNILFFAAVIGITMFVNHPVIVCLSFVCALTSGLYYDKTKTALFLLRFVFPMTLIISIINPIVNHAGATPLFYFPWGNALTLESVLFGLNSAIALSAVMLWFSFMNRIMTSDKYVCLFGKAAPILSLLLSMTLRFVPGFIKRFREVHAAQKMMQPEKKSFLKRLKITANSLSAVTSLSLESAIETADSMKSRGYGLKGRTAYSIFKFCFADTVFLSAAILFCALNITLFASRVIHFRFFPDIKGYLFGIIEILLYIITLCFMLLPMIYDIGEGRRWKKLKSKI